MEIFNNFPFLYIKKIYMITIESAEPQIQLTPKDQYFVNLINNRITMYGQIPYTVPTKLIIEIIKESARFFYRYYWRAAETAFYRLPLLEINNFLQMSDPSADVSHLVGAEVTLPSYINVVKEVFETNKDNTATAQELIENIQSLNRVSPYGQSLMGINNNLFITEAACQLIEQQAFHAIFGTAVVFHYSNLTHRIRFATPVYSNLILECLANVDIQNLYNDDLFIRHTIARTKQELKRLIAGHVFELPGGTTLNADEICNNIEDVEKVEDIVKASSGIGDIIMSR